MLAKQVYTYFHRFINNSAVFGAMLSCFCIIVQVWWDGAHDAVSPLAISPLAR